MKKCTFIFLIFAIVLAQDAYALFYECTYKTKTGAKAVSSFNPAHKHKENYSELYTAYKTGNCRELYIKKYFIDATSCNIQFYKYNMQISNLSCAGNKQSALKRLKEIAKRDFGYSGI